MAHAEWCDLSVTRSWHYLSAARPQARHLGHTAMASARSKCGCPENVVAKRLRRLKRLQDSCQND